MMGVAFTGPMAAAPGVPCVAMVFEPDNSVELNGSPVTLADLAARLSTIARRRPRPGLCLTAGPQSSYAEIEAAMRVIQRSGLSVNMTGVQAKPGN